MPRSRASQDEAVTSRDVPPETVGRPARYNASCSPVRFDPTATADKLLSGLLAEGVPVLAADAQSPSLVEEAGANFIFREMLDWPARDPSVTFLLTRCACRDRPLSMDALPNTLLPAGAYSFRRALFRLRPSQQPALRRRGEMQARASCGA